MGSIVSVLLSTFGYIGTDMSKTNKLKKQLSKWGSGKKGGISENQDIGNGYIGNRMYFRYI